MSRTGPGFALVGFLWVAFFLNYVDRQMVYSMFPALQRELGFAGARLGLIGSVFQWVYTISMPLAGRLADSGRRERMIIASMALWSVATLGCGLAGAEWSFLGWRAAMGLTESLYYPASLALIATAYPVAERSRAMGIHQSAQLVGVVFGGWYGGWSADHVGWRTAFVFAALFGLGYAVVLWRGLRGFEPAVAVVSATRGRWTDLFRLRCYGALCVAFAAFCAMQWMFFAWFPSYLGERFQLSMTDAGWNATVFVQGSTVLGILAGGALADRVSRRWAAGRFYVAALGVMLCAPFAYFTFAADSLMTARLFSCGFGLFAGSLSANAFAAAYDVVGPENRGLAGGVLNMTGGISSSVMIYLAGLWRATVGFPVMLFWMMVVAMAAAGLVLVTARRWFGLEAVPAN